MQRGSSRRPPRSRSSLARTSCGGSSRSGGGGDVAGYRRAVDQGVLVRIGQGPAPHGAADRRPAADQVGAGHSCLLGLGGAAQRVVGGDDQPGQQFVAARHVAVHRRRRRAELTGDGPQAEPGSTVGGQVPAGVSRIWRVISARFCSRAARDTGGRPCPVGFIITSCPAAPSLGTPASIARPRRGSQAAAFSIPSPPG